MSKRELSQNIPTVKSKSSARHGITTSAGWQRPRKRNERLEAIRRTPSTVVCKGSHAVPARYACKRKIE